MTLMQLLLTIKGMIEQNPDLMDNPVNVRLKNSNSQPATVEAVDITDNNEMVLECENETVHLRRH